MRLFSLSVPQQAISIASFVLLWQMAGWFGWLTDTIIPAPSGIIQAAIDGNNKGFLWRDLWTSILRVFPALLIGSFLGALTGVVSGRVRLFSDTIGPVLHMWRALPAVALAPLFIQFFGINETSKIIIIASGVFFPVWVSTHQGAGLVHRTYLDLSKCYELSTWSFYKNIVIPSTVPFTMAGIRNGIAMAYIMLFVAEWIGASNGIGYRISIAHIVFRMDLMCLGLLELGLLAFLTDYTFIRSSHHFFPWLEHARQ